MKLQGLKVVQLLNATGVFLGNEPHNRGLVVRSNASYVKRPRELDDYLLCGVYNKAVVPLELSEVVLPEQSLADAEAYRTITKMVSEDVCKGLKSHQGVFVVGGTCVQVVGIAGGIRQAFGADAPLGIIWLDAHGDINIPETSHSGMLGGMPFATVLGMCLPDWSESCGLVPPFDPQYAILSDARSFDPEEAENVKDSALKIITTSDFCSPRKWSEVVSDLASRVSTIYLHIDADIVDSLYLPSVNTPEPNGPDIWTLLDNIKTVMQTGKVAAASLASIYFDAEGRGKERNAEQQQAILSGIRMIATIMDNWKEWVEP